MTRHNTPNQNHHWNTLHFTPNYLTRYQSYDATTNTTTAQVTLFPVTKRPHFYQSSSPLSVIIPFIKQHYHHHCPYQHIQSSHYSDPASIPATSTGSLHQGPASSPQRPAQRPAPAASTQRPAPASSPRPVSTQPSPGHGHRSPATVSYEMLRKLRPRAACSVCL